MLLLFNGPEALLLLYSGLGALLLLLNGPEALLLLSIGLEALLLLLLTGLGGLGALLLFLFLLSLPCPPSRTIVSLLALVYVALNDRVRSNGNLRRRQLPRKMLSNLLRKWLQIGRGERKGGGREWGGSLDKAKGESLDRPREPVLADPQSQPARTRRVVLRRVEQSQS